MSTNSKPYAAVIRSSDRVKERQRVGTYRGDEDQVEAVERYAGDRMRVEWLPPELDVSGGLPIDHPKRASLRRAIEGVENGDYAGIVVANLKRLTRSRDGYLIWERVEAAGGTVHCARERLDTSTAYGRRIRDHELADAVCEREEHAERHAARRAKTVERGMWRQRQTPRGLTFAGPPNADGKCHGIARTLVPGPDAEDVREAFRDRAAGVAMVTIAERLKMTPSGVRHMLANRVYVGELRDGSNVKLNAHEPLVTEAEFEAAQSKTARPPRSKEMDGPALLAGIIRCASCGHIMSRKTTKQVLYGCAVHHSGGRCPKPANITTANVDAYIERIALAELDRLAVTSSEGHGVQRAEAAVADIQRRIKTAYKLAVAAGLDDTDTADELRELKAQEQDALETLRIERAREPSIPIRGKTGADVWGDCDATQRNVLLRSLLKAVIVAPAGRGKRVPITDRVRVIAHDADFELPNGNTAEKAIGIVPMTTTVNRARTPA
jgi:DNA invertase Pin-like site-specific DNA recombinase